MSALPRDKSGSSTHHYLNRYGAYSGAFTLVLLAIQFALSNGLSEHQKLLERTVDANLSAFLYLLLIAAPIGLIPLALVIGFVRDHFVTPKNALLREVADTESAFCEAQTKLDAEIEQRQEIARQLQIQVTALEIAANAVMIVDWEGRIGWVNHAFCQLTGYTSEEVLGQPFSLLKSELNDESFYGNILSVILSGRPWQGEVLSRRKDGTFYAEEMTVTPLRNEKNEITNFIAIKNDITRRKRMEEALRQSEERFQRFSSSISDIIYRYDPYANSFEFVSPSFATLSGYSMQEITQDPGAFMSRITHPEDAVRVFSELEQQIQRGPAAGSQHIEYRIRRKDGQCLWVRDLKDLEFSPEGGLLCVNGVMSNITERKEAEEELRRHRDRLDDLVRERTSELSAVNERLRNDIYERKLAEVRNIRLATAVEQSAEVIFITDSAGNIQYVNPAFERTTGYTRTEVLGKKPKILKSGRHELQFYAELWSSILHGQVWTGHIINKRKDGGIWEEEATISPVRDANGHIINFVAVARDVTQEVAMEKQLRQAQKLESIGQLAAGIAHEINTPTQYVGDNTRFIQTSINELVELLHLHRELLNAHRDVLPAENCAFIDERIDAADLDFLLSEIPLAIKQTLDGVERVTEIVRAMKEFSHPGSEERASVDLNSAIKGTLIVARNEYKYVAEVDLQLDSTLPTVLCLPGELNQVFLNIFVNAAHAIEEKNKRDGATNKGVIGVTTQQLDDKWVEIRISDTGAGIPEAIRHKVFDPFFTTKSVGKGTGQGLAIAHSVIVEKHKGTIDFISEEGKGTTFIIRLPI